MNYQNPELQSLLAAEYVTGTLHGAARRRFEALLDHDSGLREAVVYWQRRLYPLNDRIASVNPPAAIWPQLTRRLGFESESSKPQSWLERLGLNNLWPFAATFAILVVLTGLLLYPQEPVFEADYQAQISDQQQSLWQVSIDTASNRLAFIPTGITARTDDKRYELWLLPNDGSAPRSLGLLPTDNKLVLTYDNASDLLDASGLAVSLEPAGGSPTGLPTGPVLYQASIAPVKG